MHATPFTTDKLRALASFIKPFQSQLGQAKKAILVARHLPSMKKAWPLSIMSGAVIKIQWLGCQCF